MGVHPRRNYLISGATTCHQMKPTLIQATSLRSESTSFCPTLRERGKQYLPGTLQQQCNQEASLLLLLLVQVLLFWSHVGPTFFHGRIVGRFCFRAGSSSSSFNSRAVAPAATTTATEAVAATAPATAASSPTTTYIRIYLYTPTPARTPPTAAAAGTYGYSYG